MAGGCCSRAPGPWGGLPISSMSLVPTMFPSIRLSARVNPTAGGPSAVSSVSLNVTGFQSGEMGCRTASDMSRICFSITCLLTGSGPAPRTFFDWLRLLRPRHGC